MNTKTKLDRNSIKVRLFTYFLFFAAVIIFLMWFLQVLFIDRFYEDMKLKEASSMAHEISEAYQESGNVMELSDLITEISAASDTYIRVETGNGKTLLVPLYAGFSQQYLYSMQATNLRYKLKGFNLQSISEIVPGTDNMRMLIYATYLNRATDSDDDKLNDINSTILYMFTPLYPVQSTVAILRRQLFYITFISLFLALTMAYLMATRISRPIRNITSSAAEMGKGNYGVKFRGGQFSELTELASTLTAASRELEKTNLYQKDLIANVSHDLKTPLTMIKSYAEMIRDLSGNNPEKRDKHLAVIIEETDRLNTLVNDMLSLSRMQRRTTVLERTGFDIGALITEILKPYEILADQEDYIFYWEIPTEPLIVDGDEQKIQQVISNLLNNAVKYCGEDKQIIIEPHKLRGKLRIEISDHGNGIAPEELSHVWERYYKSSTHHVRPTDGSGLGLSIVREILTLHNADYGVESKLGEGTTFWFELELAKKETPKRK